MKKIIIALVLPAIFLFSCSENEDVMSPYQDFEPENLENLSLNLLQSIETPYQSALQTSGGRTSEMDVRALMETLLAGAKVIDVSLDEERGLQVIELEIKMAQGGIVEVKLLTDLSHIVELEGKRGPFNYEIDPMGSFITLAQALSAAQAEIDGQMIRWELELEENDTWEYEIHLRSQGRLYEVEIHAFTGEVISIKQFDDDDEEKYHDYFEDGDDYNAPQEIIDKALAILDGEVIYSEGDDDDYEVYIETANGGVVAFEFDDDGDLEEVEGEKGPFDYNFQIDGLISFNEAKNAALNEADGQIKNWDLDLVDDKPYFEFEIMFNGVEYEIEIDAVSGEVLDVETDDDEDWDDDEDNDDDDDNDNNDD